MLKILFLILFVISSAVFAQQSENNEQKEKPKSTLLSRSVFSSLRISAMISSRSSLVSAFGRKVLFDEFGKISQKELKLRTQKLREKLEEPASKNEGLRAYLFFYKGSDEKPLSETRKFIINVLYDNCRDCYGYHGGFITFVDAGKLEKQKIQFWLSPRGAEVPEPEK